MTDRFNMNFPNDKHHVFEWLMKQPNKSGLLIEALERMESSGESQAGVSPEPSEEEMAAYNAKLEYIFNLTIGHDMGREGYGNEETFIRINLEDNSLNRILKWRVSNLRKLHPKEAEEVLAMWAKRYPRTYALARM